MSRRIFLHVGSPKTGTTFLQQVLWSQRELAETQGLLLPLESFFEHFLASLDVRDLASRPEHPPRAVGIWDKAVAESLAWRGNVLISHELFASATAEQAQRAIEAFGVDAEVHVVLTARDLVRQIPAEWQEHVKHRSQKTFAEFLEDLEKDTEGTGWFWRVQDFADVLDRWGRTLPRERVHVVTVPSAGAEPTMLWTRFASLLGLDPGSFDTSGSRPNTSLGAEQVELLRRVNAALGKRLPLPGPYAADVKNVFAQRVLSRRPGSRFGLDADATAFAVHRSREIAAALERQRVDVVGDLAELVPASPGPRASDQAEPREVPDDVLLTEAVAALAGLLDEHRARRQERDRQLRELRQRPVRYLLALQTERSPALMRIRRTYERARASAARARRGPG